MCQSHLLHTGRIQDWWDPRWPWPPNCPWAWPSGRCHCSSGVTPKRGAFSVLKFSDRWRPLQSSRTTLPHGPAPDSGAQKGAACRDAAPAAPPLLGCSVASSFPFSPLPPLHSPLLLLSPHHRAMARAKFSHTSPSPSSCNEFEVASRAAQDPRWLTAIQIGGQPAHKGSPGQRQQKHGTFFFFQKKWSPAGACCISHTSQGQP